MVDSVLPYFDLSVQLAGVQYEYNHKQTLYGTLYCTAYWSSRLDWRALCLFHNRYVSLNINNVDFYLELQFIKVLNFIIYGNCTELDIFITFFSDS